MSYDTSATGDKLTGQFGAGLSEPFTIVAWTKKTAAQWADTSDDKLVHLNEDTADLNSSHGIINRGTADEVSAASWRESDAARAQASEGFADGTYDDTWVLIVAVFNTDSDRTIYIENSTNKTNDTSLRTTNPVDEIAVGGATQTTFQQWAGLAAEIAIFDIALTDANVDALQTAAETGIAPNTIAPADCIGYWSLNTDSLEHADQSGNGGPTLTVQSAAPFSSDHPIILRSNVKVGATTTSDRLSIFGVDMPKPSTTNHTIDANTTLVVVDVWSAGNETAQNDADFSVVWDLAGVNEPLTRIHLPTRVSKTSNDPHVQTWALLNPTIKTADMTFDLESTSEYTNVVVHITNYSGTITDSLGRAISFIGDDVNLADSSTCDIISGGAGGTLLHAIAAFKGVDTDPLDLSAGWSSISTKYDEATGVADWATHLANKDAPSAITWDAQGSDPDENNMGVMFQIAAPGIEMKHIMVRDDARYFRQNTGWGAFSAENSAIQLEDLEPYSDYLFFYNCGLNGTDTAQVFEFRIRENSGPGAERPGSYAGLEPRRNNGYDNQTYMFMERYQTNSTPRDYRFQGKGPSGFGQRSGFFYACAIRLDDLSVDDFAYSEDLTVLPNLDNTSWEDGESVTIGNGSDDYLILATGYIDVDGDNTEIRMRVDVGGTPAGDHIAMEGEDNVGEKYCIGMIQFVAAPATDTVITNQFQTDSATAGLMDVDQNRIFALRLNACEDYVGQRDTNNTNIDAIDTDVIVSTLTHVTDTIAPRDWAFFSMAIHDAEDARQIRREISDTGGRGSISGGTPNTQSIAMLTGHGATQVNPIPLIGELTAVADNTAFDIDFTVEEDQDITPETVIIDTHMVGFTYALKEVSLYPTFVASATSFQDNPQGATSTVIIPVHSNGDLLVIFIMTTSSTPSDPAIAINTPSGWTKEEDIEAGTDTAIRFTCFTKAGDGIESSVDITLSGDVNHSFAASCTAYSGASITIDVSNTAVQESGTDMTAPSVTTTGPNRRIVYAFAFDDNLATEVDVITDAGFNGVLRGFVVEAGGGGDNGGAVGTSDEHQAATGASNTCVFSTGDDDAGCAITIALAPISLVDPITASPDLAITAAADLKGKGELDTTAALAITTAADLKGKGKLDATAALDITATADLKGAGPLDATPDLIFGTAADLKSKGKLDTTAALVITSTADLEATGKLDVTAALVITATADLQPIARLNATPDLIFGTAANLTTESSLDATAALAITSTADLEAIGKLDTTAALVITSAADLEATGKLDSTAALDITAVADLSAKVALDATAALDITAAADLKSKGGLGTTSALAITTAANLQGRGKLDTTAALAITATADLELDGKIDTATIISFIAAANLEAMGKLDTSPALLFSSIADLIDATPPASFPATLRIL